MFVFLLFYYFVIACTALIWWTFKLMVVLALAALVVLRFAALWALRRCGMLASEDRPV